MKVTAAEGCMYFGPKSEKWIDAFSGNGFVTFGHNSHLVRGSFEHNNSILASVLEVDWEERLTGLLKKSTGKGFWVPFSSEATAIEAALGVALNCHSACSNLRGRVMVVGDGGFGHSIVAYQLQGEGVDLRHPFDIMPVPVSAFLEEPLHAELEEAEVAAILFEPVSRRTGERIPISVVDKLKAYAHQHDALLVSNDSFSGFGRCHQYCFTYTDEVDIIVAGSQLTQGLPFGIIGMREELHSFMPYYTPPFNHPFLLALSYDVLSCIQKSFADLGSFATRSLGIGDTWFKELEGYRPIVNGSLIHIPVSRQQKYDVVRNLLNRKIVCGFDSKHIIFAPCFVTPLEVTMETIKRVKSILSDLGVPENA